MQEKIRYITEREVSSITGLALPTLRNHRFIRCGIPYSKLGRAVRYKLEDVLHFCESRKIETNN
ncbi:MAG: DNA-binding protein [Syntrophales bacterium LBB04]|nr:DNA-binding protein [Syntrophales bacterium LBB04]